MPTKRIFDLVVLTSLLVPTALGLVRMASRRWSDEANEGSALELAGDALQVVGI